MHLPVRCVTIKCVGDRSVGMLEIVKGEIHDHETIVTGWLPRRHDLSYSTALYVC